MLNSLLTAIQTLTRIPVPSPAIAPEGRVLAWSAVFYPLVGLLPAGAAIALDELLSPRLPPEIVALCILAAWVLMTGALHEDGLADVCDAFGSPRPREEIFRILKDSRIGTYGAVGLTLALFARWQSTALVLEGTAAAALIASQVLPRAGIVLAAYSAGPAISRGLGGAFAASLTFGPVVVAVVIGVALVGVIAGSITCMVSLACLVVVALLGEYFRRRIGGVTGDCLGTIEQVQQVAVLFCFVAARG